MPEEKQLKMARFRDPPLQCDPLPEGYSIVPYCSEADIASWLAICRNGLVEDDAGPKEFKECIVDEPGIVLEKDLFFLNDHELHIGTASAIVRPNGVGYINMLGMREEYCGKRLGKFLVQTAVAKLCREDIPYMYLTTDDFRLPAIRSYLKAGFLPVDWDLDMQGRWAKVLGNLQIPSVTMLNEDITPGRLLLAEQQREE